MGAWGLGFLENDEALDFLADVEENGMPLLRSAANEITRISAQQELECDDANISIVLGALCLATRGRVLPELRHSELFHNALLACRGTLSARALGQVTALVRLTLQKSELRDLWAEAGMLQKWRRKYSRLLRYLESTKSDAG